MGKILFESAIRSFPNFPKGGVLYRDISPLLEDPKLFQSSIKRMADETLAFSPTKIAAIEAKGFILGSALAYQMSLPLVLVRKPGLTPGKVRSQSFIKEYGSGEYQLREEAVRPHDRVLIVYDILAGPGASQAAISLIEESGGSVCGLCFALEISQLKGRESLDGYSIFSLMKIGQ